MTENEDEGDAWLKFKIKLLHEITEKVELYEMRESERTINKGKDIENR